jgi:tetratricopeptide (TPR) repeat protein
LLGRAHEALGELDAALAAFRHGLDPDLFGAKLGYDGGDLYLGAARVLRKLDRFGESQLALREAADIWRSMPERHPVRAGLAIENGFAALERGDPFTARAEAERARRLLPARPEWDASRDELAILQRRLVIAGAPMS